MEEDKTRLKGLWGQALSALIDEDYEGSAKKIDSIYALIGGEYPPSNAMPEINLTCARVAALMGNWGLAISMAGLARQQLESDGVRYSIEDSKYLRYFSKNVIEFCAEYSKDDTILDEAKKIRIKFSEIDQAKVKNSIKVLFKIIPAKSDKLR